MRGEVNMKETLIEKKLVNIGEKLKLRIEVSLSIFWTQKVKLFYAALLAIN